MFFPKSQKKAGCIVSLFFLTQLHSASLTATTQSPESSDTSMLSSISATPTLTQGTLSQYLSPSVTPMPGTCNGLTGGLLRACDDFIQRYSSEEYTGILSLPDRTQVVTSYGELVKCFDEQDQSVCANADEHHYLILMDAHEFEFPDQVIEHAARRSYAIKGVYPDTTIRLSEDADTRNDGSDALLRVRRTAQLIVDGISWNTHENTANPNSTLAPGSGDHSPEVLDLAMDIRYPAGPVIIRDNKFRHSGQQIRPTGFIDIRSPDPDLSDKGLIEIRDNVVDSTNLYSDENFADINNNTSKLLFIECRNQDRDRRSCEEAYARITGNVFTGGSADNSSGGNHTDGSGSIDRSRDFEGSGSAGNTLPSESEILLLTPFSTVGYELLPSASPSASPSAPRPAIHSGIELRNIGHFVIENNRQEDGSALANIRIEYDNELAVMVDGIIRDNFGHPEAFRAVVPTITLVSSSSTLPTTGSIQVNNNPGYVLRNQLTLPGLRVYPGSVITSAQASEIAVHVSSTLMGSMETSAASMETTVTSMEATVTSMKTSAASMETTVTSEASSSYLFSSSKGIKSTSVNTPLPSSVPNSAISANINSNSPAELTSNGEGLSGGQVAGVVTAVVTTVVVVVVISALAVGYTLGRKRVASMEGMEMMFMNTEAE